MAKRKKDTEEAAHPKDREGEHRRGHSFIAPDRRDQIDLTGDERPEVIEVFKGKAPEKVDVGHGGDDSAGDDARQMRTEDDDGGPDRVQSGGLNRPARANVKADDEDASYSRKVQARINRERALRLKGDAQLREERAINAKNAERIAKLERGQLDIAQSGGVKDLETKIKAATEKLAAAVEEGDTKAQMALTIELGDLQGDLKLLKYDLDQKRKAREREDADAATRQADAGTEAVPDKDRTEAFITSNGHWWAKRAYTGVRAECIELDKDILADIKKGHFDAEPYSDEHFEELAARLAAKYPDLEINSPDGETYEFADEGAEKPKVNDRNERPARGPMGGLGGRNGRRDSSPLTLAKQGKVHLAEQDYAQMRVYGLDPDNDEHKKRFAKERMRTILTDERRGEVQ